MKKSIHVVRKPWLTHSVFDVAVPGGRSEEAYLDLELQMVAANPPGSLWSAIKVDERPKAKVDLDARPARQRVGTIHSAITEPELRANVRDYLFAKRKLADLEMSARASCAEMARRGMQHRDITADTTSSPSYWNAKLRPTLSISYKFYVPELARTFRDWRVL